MTANNLKQINSTNYWFKIVEFLQTNWALIEEYEDGRAIVSFIDDTSGTFDEIVFPSLEQAVGELIDNGFDLYSEATQVHDFLKPPNPPFKVAEHINGPIYSSGRFWRTESIDHQSRPTK
jgi:hypothetical protein